MSGDSYVVTMKHAVLHLITGLMLAITCVHAQGDTLRLSWKSIPMPPNERPNSVMVVDADTMVLTASSVCRIRGTEVNRVLEPLQQQQLTTVLADGSRVYALGQNGALYTTTNDGLQWERSPHLRSVVSINRSGNHTMAIQADGRMVFLSDSATSAGFFPGARWAAAVDGATYVLGDSNLVLLTSKSTPESVVEPALASTADADGTVYVLSDQSITILSGRGRDIKTIPLRYGGWSSLYAIDGAVVAINPKARMLAIARGPATVDYVEVPSAYPGRITGVVGSADTVFVSRSLDQGSVLRYTGGTWAPLPWNIAGVPDVAVLSLTQDENGVIYAATRNDGIWAGYPPKHIMTQWSRGLQEAHPTRQFATLGGMASTLLAGFVNYRHGRIMPDSVVGPGGYGTVLGNGHFVYARLDGIVSHSMDHGATWTTTRIRDSVSTVLNLVSVEDTLYLFEQRRVLISKDEGRTWNVIEGLKQVVRPTWLLQQGKTVILGSASGTYLSTNGNTWSITRSTMATDSVEVFTSAVPLPDGTLFGGRYGLYKHSVTNNRWTFIPLPGARSAVIVGLIGRHIFCISDEGTIHRSVLPP